MDALENDRTFTTMEPSNALAGDKLKKTRKRNKESVVESQRSPPETSAESASLKSLPLSLYDMLPELRRLDLLLEQAVAKVPAIFGLEPGADPFRGLHISQTDAEQLFVHIPGVPEFGAGEHENQETSAATISESMRWLAHTFGLTPFDLEVVLLALAPELDRRYERIFGYLHDDVSRRRPSVDLALNLFCQTAEEKLANRARFGPNLPLMRYDLIRLFTDPHHVQPPLLAYYIKLDEQIMHLLLSSESLDSRLAPFARLVKPTVSFNDLVVDNETKHALRTMTVQARAERRALRLYFHGLQPVSKFQAAEALAAEIESRLLIADVRRLLESSADFAQTLPLLFREAWFKDAVLYIDNVDIVRREERAGNYHLLIDTLANGGGITIMSGTQPWVPAQRTPLGVVPISFLMPNSAERRSCWQKNLALRGLEMDQDDLNRLAETFRLTPEQIADAAATARNCAMRYQAGITAEQQGIAADLFAAARAQCGHDLARLTHKIETRYTWNDIVLADDALAQLREICRRVAYGHRVLDEWGFGRKLSLGKGLSALFAGPSGTGKTMAAEIIANEVGLDLYKIDLSGVVSKYIGETEKNLDRIFTAAENANAILFFDEADALFGKRSEVRDSHDRYANVEISYLLQKMEQYEGMCPSGKPA